MSDGDPVSWLVIERGWEVVDADGEHVGQVEEDVGEDIFSGLSISIGLLRSARFVPAERVAEITESRVRLELRSDDLELEKHKPPPRSEEIRPS